MVGRGETKPQTRRIRGEAGSDAVALKGQAVGLEIDDFIGGQGGTLSSSMKT